MTLDHAPLYWVVHIIPSHPIPPNPIIFFIGCLLVVSCFVLFPSHCMTQSLPAYPVFTGEQLSQDYRL